MHKIWWFITSFIEFHLLILSLYFAGLAGLSEGFRIVNLSLEKWSFLYYQKQMLNHHMSYQDEDEEVEIDTGEEEV